MNNILINPKNMHIPKSVIKTYFIIVNLVIPFFCFGSNYVQDSIMLRRINNSDSVFENNLTRLIDSTEITISNYNSLFYRTSIILKKRDTLVNNIKLDSSLIEKIKLNIKNNVLEFIKIDSNEAILKYQELFLKQKSNYHDLNEIENRLSLLQNVTLINIQKEIIGLRSSINELDSSYFKVLDSFYSVVTSDSVPAYFETKFRKVHYRVVAVSSVKHDVNIYNNDTKKGRDLNFIYNKETNNGKEVLAIMNAGMFERDYSPVGLLIQNFKILNKIDLNNKEGNFYMQPNGIFYIDSLNNFYIKETHDFQEQFSSNQYKGIKYATQSGPLLLNKGVIHKTFGYSSSNLNIRNGVGILRKGGNKKTFFVITDEPVSFYDFAMFFRDILQCESALYLDGTISQLYVNERKKSGVLSGGSFGPIISVTIKNKK